MRILSAIVASALAASMPAAAQPASAIEVERDGAPPGRTELGFDGGAPVDGWGATLAFTSLARPIVLAGPDGERAPVRQRATLVPGGALALGEVAVIDARLAGSSQSGDRLAALGVARPLDRYVLHDLRLGARVRVAGTASGTRAVFARGELTLPTGDAGDFAGEASWTLAWQLIGRFVLPRDVVVAGAAGVRFRGAEVRIGDRLVGDEVTGALGVVVPLPWQPCAAWPVADVRVTAELAGVLGDDVGAGRGPSPAEARGGALARLGRSFTLGARVGRGLGDQLGAPAWRAVAELTYVAAPTTSSRR